MRNRLLLLTLFFLSQQLVATAQHLIQSDNFETGTFPTSKNWSGNTDYFQTETSDGNTILRLNAPAVAGTSSLSLPETFAYGSLELGVKFFFTGLSATNKLNIYLALDKNIPDGTQNGYLLSGGESGSNDVFRFYKINNGVATSLGSDTTLINNGGEFRIKIDRDTTGTFTISVARGLTGTLHPYLSVQDTKFSEAGFTVFEVVYTASRNTGFAFDDVILSKYRPFLINTQTISEKDILLDWSEALDSNTLLTQDFSLSPGNIQPATVTLSGEKSLQLSFASAIPVGDFQLLVNPQKDRYGISSAAYSVPISINEKFNNGDIIINELMYNPPAGASNYVEIKNLSTKTIDISDWILRNKNSTAYKIPLSTSISAGEILVLAQDTSALHAVFGPRNYIKMNAFPAFVKTTTDQVRLFTSDGILVDSLLYEASWGGNGVALERRDSEVPAYFKENWGNSPSNLKGTPGLENEIEPDNIAPELVSISVVSADSILLSFNERILESSVLASHFQFTPTFSIQSATLVNANEILLILSTPLPQNQPVQLSVELLEDIFGNKMISPTVKTLEYFQTESATDGDILISEFLYDPPTGYTEFIELYNTSTKYINLSGFTYNDNSGNRKVITTAQEIIRPQEYVVIAPSKSLNDIFTEARILTMGSNFAALNNTGDQIVIYSPEGILMDSLEYTSAWGGKKVSLERRSFTVSSRFSENWGDSPNVLFATPGFVNETESDTDAPEFLNSSVNSPDSLLLHFSERLQQETAENTSSYSFSDGLTLSYARLQPDGASVSLIFSAPIEENKVYQGQILSAKDLFENEISTSVSFSFEYVQAEEALPGDLLITEFLYDPPTGYGEFIELFNVSDKVLDVAGYTYSDNAASPKVISNQSLYVKPQSYLILAPDPSLQSIFGDITIVAMGSRFNALNNSDDQIVIKNGLGVTLDSLEYDNSWGGKKVSLERRSLSAPARFKENWGDSPASLFASPGSTNLVEPDTKAPQLINTIVESEKIIFIFDEQLDETQAMQSSILTSLSRTEIYRSVSGGIITVTYSESLTLTTEFQITIGKQADIFGNETSEMIQTVQYVIVKTPFKGDLALTEFVSKASDTTPEFIEIFNKTSENIDLRQLQIADNKETVTIEILSGYDYYIKPSTYLAISTDDGFASSAGNRIAVKKLPSLNDTGSDAVVIKHNGIMLDSLMYSFPEWPISKNGQSYERKNLSLSTEDPSNWGLNPNFSHTAGKENTVDTDIPKMEIQFAGWLSDDTLSVFTSRYISNSSDADFYLDSQQILPLTIQKNHVRFLVSAPAGLQGHHISMNYFEPGFESESIVETAISSSHPQSEPLIITEILFNPLTLDDVAQSDFIEFYNPNETAIIIPNPILSTFSLSRGTQTKILLETAGFPISIPAKSYGIIYPDTVSGLQNSRLGTYFNLPDSTIAFRTNRTSLSLSATNSAIGIYSDSGEMMDSVAFSSSWHNPNVTDTKGRSLERVLLKGGSNEKTNWSTSGNPLGATPGAVNSNFINSGEIPDSKISIYPNPFSPDQDGFEDLTTVNWNLNGTNYLIQATIYDRYGRKVRTLAENIVAGKTGSLVWDGKRDDGTFSRIGIYILLFKATDSSSGKQVVFKKSVVVARMM